MYDSYLQALREAGLDQALFGSISTAPALTGDFAADAAACRPFWAALDDVQQRLVGRVGPTRHRWRPATMVATRGRRFSTGIWIRFIAA